MIPTEANLASSISHPVRPLQPDETRRWLPAIPTDRGLLLHLIVEDKQWHFKPTQSMVITIVSARVLVVDLVLLQLALPSKLVAAPAVRHQPF
eukprot:9325277-Pyramimonas_sp.AAC.1